MLIRIEMEFATVQDAINGLRDLANSFLSASSVYTLDNAQQTTHSDGASPVEAAESPFSDPPRRGRGRPPKAKAQTEEELTASTVTPETAGEASFSSGEPAPAKSNEQEVQEVIAALTDKFRTSGPEQREAIRKWRDEVGLVKMADLKPDHVPAAQQLLRDLGGA